MQRKTALPSCLRLREQSARTVSRARQIRVGRIASRVFLGHPMKAPLECLRMTAAPRITLRQSRRNTFCGRRKWDQNGTKKCFTWDQMLDFDPSFAKNTRKSMVGVTGFEPATPTSRRLWVEVPIRFGENADAMGVIRPIGRVNRGMRFAPVSTREGYVAGNGCIYGDWGMPICSTGCCVDRPWFNL